MNNETFQLLFGSVSLDHVEDPNDFFYDEKSNTYFYYKMVVDQDQIMFYDTCGRSLPFDLSDAKALGTAVFAASEIYNMHKEAEKLYESRKNKLQQLLEFWQQENAQ